VREIEEGLRFVGRNPMLRTLAAEAAIFACAGRIYGTVFLLYATRDLGLQPGLLGLIFALGGATSFVGALVTQRFITRLGIRVSLIVAFVLIGSGNGLVALAGGPGMAAGFLVAQQFVKDPAYPVLNAAQASLRQTLTPARYQGRMHASLRVVEFGGMLVGAVLGGWLGEMFGLRATLATAAVGGAAAAVPLLLFHLDGEAMQSGDLAIP
jgi:MFS family permease